MCKYGVTSGPYFPVFSPNTGRNGPEITPYLDTFHIVSYMKGNNTVSSLISLKLMVFDLQYSLDYFRCEYP